MPDDPIGALLAQAGANFESMNRNLMTLTVDVSKALSGALMAPLEALTAVGKGAGYYTAKMSSAELKRRNIFGE